MIGLFSASDELNVADVHWSGTLGPCNFLVQQTEVQPVPKRLINHLAKIDLKEPSVVETKASAIGPACSITPLRTGKEFLVKTTNLMYVLVDDPYKMGRIACANLLSDLYAVGIDNCHNVLIHMMVRESMSDQQRDIVVPEMLRGFKDCAIEAGTCITGGQTIYNPWCGIGGVATTVIGADGYVMPDNAVDGDVLVLTKPLGSGVAIWAQYLLFTKLCKSFDIKLNKKMVEVAYGRAVDSMGRLNRMAGRLLHQYETHACIDVNGSGLLCHAKALAAIQRNSVDFHIYSLPVIKYTQYIARAVDLNLRAGLATEYSGGLLIAMPRLHAAAYVAELLEEDGHQAWIIGVVTSGSRTADVIKNPRIIEQK